MHLTLRCCTQEIYCHLHAIIRSQILTTVNIKIKIFFLECHAKWSGSDVTTFLIHLTTIPCALTVEVAGSSERLLHSRT